MDNSPLCRLPAELRNRIYEYAFRTRYPIAASRSTADDWLLKRHLKLRPLQQDFGITPRPPVALLRTCKAVHEEACQLLYAVNDFQFGYQDDESLGALGQYKTFVEDIAQRNADALRSVTFVVPGHYLTVVDTRHIELIVQCIRYIRREAGTHRKCRYLLEAAARYTASDNPFDFNLYRVEVSRVRLDMRDLDSSLESAVASVKDEVAGSFVGYNLRHIHDEIMEEDTRVIGDELGLWDETPE